MTAKQTAATEEGRDTGSKPGGAVELSDQVDNLLGEASTPEIPVFGLRVSEDGISLLLDCPDPLLDLDATVNRIKDDIVKMELPEYPDKGTLKKILEKACQEGEHLVGHPIMQGWSPTPGQDGRLEWGGDYFSEGLASEDDSEVVDFWEKNDKRSVQKDEIMARVHRPIPGEPGLDIFCREIPVPKPETVKLRPGKGVTTEDEGEWVDYYAETAGRIRYQDDTIVVDDVYVIKGDVSLETGNINHTGTVQVEGDVKNGATIKTDGDLIVKGMLDPCHIQCGGSLTAGGGIVGLEEFQILVDGDVQAMYISGAVLRVGGDVSVTNEISQSDIKAFGKVIVPAGRISGGQTVSRVGIQVAEAGASGSTDTLLVVGVDFTVDKGVAERQAKIDKLEEAQEKVKAALAKAAAAENQPSDADDSLMMQLSQKSKQIGEAIIDQHMAIKADLAKSSRGSIEEVTMLREVWSGTTIQIGNEKTIVRKSIEKPRIARLVKKKVQILPLGEGNMPGD